ncbi:MAG TPA: alpha/beta family hydrolase [Fimbriimonadales bacterium]|nr:alpha/beta family hydrolase [Fimbriimonadales bacterium]
MINVNRLDVEIPFDGFSLEGYLNLPPDIKGVVVFAHGSGSSRKSVRNQFISNVLNAKNFGTLLFDLLTPEEDLEYENRFDIPLLSERLKGATEWVKQQEGCKGLPIGLFGASTGAAAAIIVAAEMGKKISAVVSRGGRPDMAMNYLERLESPILLIVGERDYDVLELNRMAFERIKAEKELAIVSNATHLFEEPGALEEVGRLAVAWFEKYLKAHNPSVVL